jgi:hypothetical protein
MARCALLRTRQAAGRNLDLHRWRLSVTRTIVGVNDRIESADGRTAPPGLGSWTPSSA